MGQEISIVLWEMEMGRRIYLFLVAATQAGSEGMAWCYTGEGLVGLRKTVCQRAMGIASSCWSSGSVVAVLSDKGFGFWVVLNSAGVRDPCESFPTQAIL